MNLKSKRQHRISRHSRVRSKITGTSSRPRVAVFKSNQHIYVQVIDDEANKTLLSVSDIEAKKGKPSSRAQAEGKSVKASEAGESLAVKMKEKGLAEAVFDRGGFKFHGRVKAVADGLRKGGIKI